MESSRDNRSPAEDFKKKRENLRLFIEANQASAPVKKQPAASAVIRKPAENGIKPATIKHAMDDAVKPSKLNAAVLEFYNVQRKFHSDMKALTDKLNEAMQHVPDKDKQVIRELLAPYRLLSDNPFVEEPTGDVDQDVSHILSVIKDKNDKFKTTLSALLDSASNLGDLKKQLERLKRDEVFKKNVNDKLGSWMRMESGVDQPFQNLIRYELLLKAIQRELIDSGYEPTEEALDVVMASIESIVPEVANINEFKEVVLKINRMDRVLLQLEALENGRANLSDANKADKFEKLIFIESVRSILRNQKNNIARNGGEDIPDFMKAVLELLQELAKKYLAQNHNGFVYNYVSYVASAASDAYSIMTYIPLSMFGAAEEANKVINPVDELHQIINDLDEGVQQTDVILRMLEISNRSKARY